MASAVSLGSTVWLAKVDNGTLRSAYRAFATTGKTQSPHSQELIKPAPALRLRARTQCQRLSLRVRRPRAAERPSHPERSGFGERGNSLVDPRASTSTFFKSAADAISTVPSSRTRLFASPCSKMTGTRCSFKRKRESRSRGDLACASKGVCEVGTARSERSQSVVDLTLGIAFEFIGKQMRPHNAGLPPATPASSAVRKQFLS